MKITKWDRGELLVQEYYKLRLTKPEYERDNFTLSFYSSLNKEEKQLIKYRLQELIRAGVSSWENDGLYTLLMNDYTKGELL